MTIEEVWVDLFFFLIKVQNFKVPAFETVCWGPRGRQRCRPLRDEAFAHPSSHEAKKATAASPWVAGIGVALRAGGCDICRMGRAHSWGSGLVC